MTTDYVMACAIDDLEVNTTKLVEIDGKLVLLANDEGTIHALSGYCTHDGQMLDGEEVHDGQVECTRHGAMFDVQTGDVTQMPAVTGLKKYSVKVDEGMILVAIE